MRKTAILAVIASVAIAGASAAGTPAATLDLKIENEGMLPISAMFPPLSQDDIRMRCAGFVRAITVRENLARAMGQSGLDGFSLVSRLDIPAGDAAKADFVTPYMVAFGPIDPLRTMRSGLFRADMETCTEVSNASVL